MEDQKTILKILEGIDSNCIMLRKLNKRNLLVKRQNIGEKQPGGTFVIDSFACLQSIVAITYGSTNSL